MASTGKPHHRKVLIIVENLPVPFDRRVWQEAQTLTEAGYKVSIICPLGQGAEEECLTLDGIDIYRHPLPLEANGAWGYLAEYSAALWHEFQLARKVLRTQGIDIIHACNPPDTIFLIAIYFKIFHRVKFVFDHHDINPELFEAKFDKRGPLYWLLRLLERLTFMTADVSIATNESYKDIAIHRGHMPQDRVFVVRSGPKLDRLKLLPGSRDFHNKRKYLVAYLGVIGRQEGLDLLLESVRHIIFDKNRKDMQFVIIGSGPELDTIKRLCHSLKLDDYITFTGRISDDLLLKIMNSADICVNPDRANEMNDKSTMNKIMEYMALRKPIVQFDLKEGRFSARDASVYAKPNDTVDFAVKILELIDDPERRKIMANYGRKRVEEILCWDTQKSCLLAAYNRLFTA